MKTNNKENYAVALLLAVFGSILFSFTKPMGGDSFEIYLNNKLVVQQVVVKMKEVKTISLDQSNYNGEIGIVYSHCGLSGKDRKIIIRDAQSKVLKQWSFANVSGAGNNTMNCKTRDIIDLQRNNNDSSLSLYYSSNELPAGKLLAQINVLKNSQVKP